MSNETLTQMAVNLLEAIDNDEILNQKGTSAIVKLIKGDAARATIRHAIVSTGSDKVRFVEGLKAVLAHYNSGASISVRPLCDDAAIDGSSGKTLERNIIPLLVELGVIIKAGERSYHWQAAHLIGHKPSLLDTVLSSFAATPEKLAVKAASERAYAEKCKLAADTKRETYALRRKEAAIRTQAAIQQADELAAANPTPASWLDSVKANPLPVAFVLLMVVGIAASMTTPNQAQPSPLLAAMPSPNGSPTLDPRILAGE